MGSHFDNQGLRFHAAKNNEHNIPYSSIMLHYFSDLLDKQAHLVEAKGAWIIVPIFGINCFVMAWFADVHIWQDNFDLIKNILLSVIGISMGLMGAVNTFMGMKKRIREYNEQNKKKSNNKKSA